MTANQNLRITSYLYREQKNTLVIYRPNSSLKVSSEDPGSPTNYRKMVSRINLYVAFVFCGILFVVEAYPEKRHGKKIQFLSCISISYNYKPLDLRAYFALNMNSLLINLKKRRGICTKFGKKLGRLQVTSARHKFSYRSVGQPNL